MCATALNFLTIGRTVYIFSIYKGECASVMGGKFLSDFTIC